MGKFALWRSFAATGLRYTRMLMRNVTSLHYLLDDVTSLTRLQVPQRRWACRLRDYSALRASPFGSPLRAIAAAARVVELPTTGS